MDTAECNAEPPHLTRTTLINGPQEGCYMHVKITRAVNPASLTNNITAQTGKDKDNGKEHENGQKTKNEELHVNKKMVINERSNDVTGTLLTDEKATATRRTKTFEKDR